MLIIKLRGMIIFNLFEAYNIVKCLASKVLPLFEGGVRGGKCKYQQYKLSTYFRT